MANSYDLSKLDPNSFEHLVNMLALRVLGAGYTGFGPGPDGGRDGYFEGKSKYPSEKENWSGVWYVQSKFHMPHLSKDPQKWLFGKIEEELEAFEKEESNRVWPDNWIIATNIDPSGVPRKGLFDKAKKVIHEKNPKLAKRFHIWGGSKIVSLLTIHKEVAKYYSHFLTPGHVIAEIYKSLVENRASVEDILRFLIVREFEAHQYTKLDQAGSEADSRPGVHELFVDLPFTNDEHEYQGLIADELFKTSAKNHKIKSSPEGKEWDKWERHPSRARVLFVLGGPGQGKSTTGQYFSQIHRAALILDWKNGPVLNKCRDSARDIKILAEKRGHWVVSPRIPINIELRDYAQWFGNVADDTPGGVLTYLAAKISSSVEVEINPNTLKRALKEQRWFIVFDGLDEVPNDVKGALSNKIKDFINHTVVECDSDVHFLCTSRPQGYSGQLDDIDPAIARLIDLNSEKALECAEPVIRIGRSETEAKKGFEILRSAIKSPAVRSLMTTPLQSHIMAVVVRDGKKPPERRWQLFENFYQVIKRREANRDLPDSRLAKLLLEEDRLLRSIHNRLGFVLHAKAEKSEGAQTSLTRTEFKVLAKRAVSDMKDNNVNETVEALMEATETRLVLVNTPDDGGSLRFDIRPLQEFFAAEFVHDGIGLDEYRKRMACLAGDAHWREVMHFLLSAMLEASRRNEIDASVLILESLNEGDVDYERPLKRRLARGALLVAKLLQDGVLEQDKRWRQMFRSCLEPLAGSVDPEDVDVICNIQHPDSRSWLIDYLMERLREADSSESIGAAITLTHLLSDEDPRTIQCSTILRNKPHNYWSAIIAARSYDRGFTGQERRISYWFSILLLDLAASADWYKLETGSIEIIIELLFRRSPYLRKIISERGMPEVYYDLIELSSSSVWHYTEDNQETIRDYGFAVLMGSERNWLGGRFVVESLERANPTGVQNEGFGYLSVIESAWRFSKEKTFESFQRLVRNIRTDAALKINAIPRFLLNYFPFDFEGEFEKSFDVTEEEFSEFLKGKRQRPYGLFAIDYRKGVSKEDWASVVEDYPDLAINFFFNWDIYAPGEEHITFLESVGYIDCLISRIIRQPSVLRVVNFSRWGRLLSVAPHKEAEVRDAFLKCVDSNRAENNIYRTRSYNFPFAIKLPEEKALLPLMLRSVQNETYLRDGRVKVSYSAFRRSKSANFISKIIKDYISDVRDLGLIDFDKDQIGTYDGYLALIMLMHPDLESELKDFVDVILGAFSSEKDSDLLDSILIYIYIYHSEAEPEAVRLMSGLLELCRCDFKLRSHFKKVLLAWREESHYPADRANALESWLNLSG